MKGITITAAILGLLATAHAQPPDMSQVQIKTNKIAGNDTVKILNAASAALARPASNTQPRVPPLWDGHTADRIAEVLSGSE